MPSPKHLEAPEYSPEDFLSPEQRLDAIAEILATIALRSFKQKQNHETTTPDNP